MDLREIAMQRYAAREFKSVKIPEEKVREVVDILRYAPSALNLQPWRIKIVSDTETKQKLVAHTFTPRQVITCSHLLVFCANTDIDEVLDAARRAAERAGQEKERVNYVMEIVERIKGRLGLQWAREQVFIALGFALLAAKALGLDGCPMTGFDAEAYARILDIPPKIVPTVLLALGYASDKPIRKARLSVEEILI